MVNQRDLHKIELDFTIENLKELSWLTESIKNNLKEYRWSGFKAVDLESYDVSILASIPLSSPSLTASKIDNQEDYPFKVMIIILVSSGDKTVQKAITVPIEIKIIHENGKILSKNNDPDLQFHFKNDIVAIVRLLIQDEQFWKDFLFMITSEKILGSKLEFKYSSIEFKERWEELEKQEEKPELTIKFLGDSNTTNIVIYVIMERPANSSFIFKVYPVVNLNPSSFLNEMLSDRNYGNHSKILLSCNYASSFLDHILPKLISSSDLSLLHDFFERIKKNQSFFFPYLQAFEFINVKRDGGYPFWISATECSELGLDDEKNKNILELSGKLSHDLVEFHEHLDLRYEVKPHEKEHVIKGILNDVGWKIARVKEIIHPSNIQSLFDIPAEIKLIDEAMKWLDQRLNTELVPSYNKNLIEIIKDVNFQFIHQDLHLAQFMHDETRNKFIILDLEGDPQLKWLDKLQVYPVEKDLASLTRSLSYIKIAAFRDKMLERLPIQETKQESFRESSPLFFIAPLINYLKIEDLKGLSSHFFENSDFEIGKLIKQLNTWESRIENEILNTYSSMSPIKKDLYDFFKLSRLLTEINYESEYRPHLLFIPLTGLIELIHAI